MPRVPSSVRRTALITLALTGTLGAAGAFAATDVGTIHFTLGYKNLSSDWNLDPREVDQFGNVLPAGRASEPALGLELTWGRQGWPAQIALDVLHSSDDGISHVPRFFTIPAYDLRLRASTLELGLGLRRSINVIGLTPYLGAGGAWVRGRAVVEVSDPNAGQFGAPTAYAHTRSSAFGYWASAGVYRRLGPRFQLGLEGRYSKATLAAKPFTVDYGALPSGITTFPEVDGGGRTIHLLVGWSFPSR